MLGGEADRDIAQKLHLTAAVLSCTSRKELCARFRAVNPATHCDLDRLHKWMQGRALPRARSVYDDWVTLLGLAQGGDWLARCTLEEFRATVARPDGRPITVRAAEPAARRRGGPGILGGLRMLCGSYACYSRAWSPHYPGALIRGSLSIRPGRGAKLFASYSERLVTGSVRIDGEVVVTGRSIHLPLWETEGNLPIFFSLITPGPPASAMCGIMSGVALVAHATLPSSSRVLLIRVPPADALEATNRYLDPTPGFCSADLATLGLNPRHSATLDALAARFFANASEQVLPADQTAFAELLDPEYFAREG